MLPTHLSVCGSQHPPLHGVAPAQHASPVAPQGGASGGASCVTTSPGESRGASLADSTGASALESWPDASLLESPPVLTSPPLDPSDTVESGELPSA